MNRFCALLSCLIFAVISFSGAARAAEAMPNYPLKMPPRQEWSFSGIFGTYDKAQLQRGLKVYTQVCSSCHSLNYVHFRDLRALGYTMPQIEEFAAQYSYKTEDIHGNAATRKGVPQDSFPAPFENAAQAAAANNGAVPPDLSLMARARAAHHPLGFITDILTDYNTQGPDYIYALLTGYRDAPQGIIVPEGQYYNPYFLNGASLSMMPPLQDGMVPYNDGSPQTKQQYAKDVAAFLSWTADPHREQREKAGFYTMIFLAVTCGLLYCLKREIWDRRK